MTSPQDAATDLGLQRGVHQWIETVAILVGLGEKAGSIRTIVECDHLHGIFEHLGREIRAGEKIPEILETDRRWTPEDLLHPTVVTACILARLCPLLALVHIMDQVVMLHSTRIVLDSNSRLIDRPGIHRLMIVLKTMTDLG